MSEMELNMGASDTGPSGGWSKSGDLVTGNTVKTATMQFEFEESGDYTVQFNIDTIKAVTPTSNGAGGFNESAAQICVATIQWAVAGNTISRKVTVSNGMTITGVATAVRVVISDDSIPPVAPNTLVQQTYSVNVSVAKGSRPTSGVPPLFVQTRDSSGNRSPGVLVGAGSVNVPVPTDIGANSVYVAGPFVFPFANGGIGPCFINVTQQQSGGAGGDLISYNADVEQWVPLLPGCTSLNIIYVGITPPGVMECTVVFGIDG